MKKINGKSLCVFSLRGGVGKTTTILNLAGISSLNKKSVLIIDADLTGGCVCSYLNLKMKKTISDVIEDMQNKTFNKLDDYVAKYNDYISVLASPIDPRDAVKVSPEYFEIILEKALNNYDLVLIDTSPVLDELNAFILDIALEKLIIVNNDLITLKNNSNLLKICEDANVKNIKILLNESVNPDKKYFDNYNIKNILNSNIDYKVSKDMYLRSFDIYVNEGKIMTLDKKFVKCFPKMHKTYNLIINDLMEMQDEK